MRKSIRFLGCFVFLFEGMGGLDLVPAHQATSTEVNSGNREEFVQKICERTLEMANGIPSGDEGFLKLTATVMVIAMTESPKRPLVENNEAVILSLAILVGEDRVRSLARFRFSLKANEVERLRNRISLRNRNDLARHFWVSAGLAVLTGEKQALAVGVSKELMDSVPGGSGFSFVDLLADQAGVRFAVNAIRDDAHATVLKNRIEKGLTIPDIIPNIEELPEGISADLFQTEYGGMGGKKTRELLKNIQSRLESCKALKNNEP